MSRWSLLICLTLCLLGGCSSNLPDKTYYQLPLPPASGDQQQIQGKRLLWLEQVQLADFLSGEGLVYQTSAVSYHLASRHLWASPLAQQLTNSLVSELNQHLPGWLVATSPLSNDEDRLQLTISGFHGRYDGKVIIRGEWLLKHQQQVIKHPFYLVMTQQQDGYDALVQLLSQGWQQQAQQIARQLQELP